MGIFVNTEKKQKIIWVGVEDLSPSTMQPRTRFDQNKIAELASSLAVHGVLQPLLVRKLAAGFEIIAGERRYRAAKHAGLARVPCIAMDLVDDDALAIALVENIQRQDLNPIEEALAYLRLKETLKLNQEEIATRVGKDRASVANTLRLLRLPKVVQELLIDESLSMGHARALLSLDSSDLMGLIAKKIIRDGLNVRRVESLIRSIKSGHQLDAQKLLSNSQDPLERDIRQKLEHAVGARVELRRENSGYAVTMHFADAEQLNNLLDALEIDL